jgi:hypothetical protein
VIRCLAIVIVLCAGSARADKAAADAAFAEAKRLVAAGKLAEACPKFEVSYNEDPQVGSLLNLADCHERTGRLATARAEFRSAIELAHLRKDAREGYASTRASALDGRVAHLVLHERAGVDGLTVKLDDRDVTAMIDSDLPIDAGHHVIAATTVTGATWSSALDIEADGVRRELTVPGELAAPPTIAPRPAPAAPAAPPTISYSDDHARNLRHVIAAGIAGVGLAVAGVGMYYGHRAYHDWDASQNPADPSYCNTDNVCGATGRSLVDSAKSAATTSDILVGAGAGAIAAAAIVWFTAPAERVVVTPIVGGGGVGGSIAIRF